MSDNAQKFFTPEVLLDHVAVLRAAGPLQSFELARRFRRGGMTGRIYRVQNARRRFAVSTFTLPNGKLEQFLILPMP